MRTKKQVRDKLYTQAFFGQLSASCPCGLESCTSAKAKEFIGRFLPGGDQAMEVACREFDEMTKSLEEMRSLEESGGLDEADRINIGGTFELMDIEATIDHVEKIGLYFNRVHDTKLAALLKRAVDAQKLAEGTANDSATLKADLDLIIGQWEARTELVSIAASIVQLFNIEKRFSFFEQDCRHIRYQVEAWAGDTVDNDPPTLRMYFKSATKLDAVTKKTKKPKHRKHRDISAILGDSRRLGKLAVKDTEELNKRIPEQEAQIPSLPTTLTYNGHPVSKDIPEAVRQSVYDLGFTCNDIHQVRAELSRLQEAIGGTLMTWVTTSKEAWQYGQKHIHEFPDLRKYEYTRVTLRASYLVAFREEYKIFTYFNTTDRPKGLCPELEKTFSKIENQEKINMGWDERMRKLKDDFISVEDMVKRLDLLSETPNEDVGTTEKTDEWWSYLQRLPSKT